jgi:hypothetical protein
MYFELIIWETQKKKKKKGPTQENHMANYKLTQKITLSASFPLTSFPVLLVFDIIVIFQKFILFLFSP